MSGQILRPYNPASWFHPKGIYKVLAKLNPKLPDVEGMLFLTFTFDRLLFANPSLAFDHGRDRLRRVFYHLRKGVVWEGKRYVIDEPYCVKVEFHADGWPHFHVIFLTRRFLPARLLTALWGNGRTNVGRITNDEFRYLLKYVTKSGTLPEWALSRRRLRVFQSSRGFYTTTAEPKPEAKKTGRTRRRPGSLGQRIERWRRTALLQTGEQFERVILGAPYPELLAQLIFSVALEGRYLGGGHILINDSQELFPWINQTSALP
jgi:hypothetical protein